MVFSFLFLSVAVYMVRHWASQTWLSWCVAVCILGAVALSGLEYCVNLITGTGVNGAVFYHMGTGLKGGDISQYLLPGLGAVAVLAGVAGLLWHFRRYLQPGATDATWWINPGIATLSLCAVFSHPVSVASAQHMLRFSLVAQQPDGFIAISSNQARPERPKNLVLIYLESVERTYLDPDRFPGLTPNLSALQTRAVSFSNVGQTTGAGFTIGAKVASQCGVPLIMPGGANSMRVNQFLRGATCLGDILSEAGYAMSYLGGASLEFAGKGAFYRTHGYDEVLGLQEILPTLRDQTYVAEWGLQDDTLLELAQTRFEALAKQDRPFGLTLLTLDTHHPNGHAETNRACGEQQYQDGSNPMLNSVKCTDALIGRFISDILSGPYGHDTVIAVVSDHLAMVNSATALLEEGPRRNLFMVLDGSAQATGVSIDRPATTLDIGPTLLSLLDFDAEKMGFGVDLLSEAATLPETLGVGESGTNTLDDFVMGFRDVYTRLWAFPDISDGLYVNIERGEVQFGHSAFQMPALLAFDAGHTIDHAVLGDSRAEETLSEAALNLPDGKSYFWFDTCAALSVDVGTTAPEGKALCFLAGRRGAPTKLHEIGRVNYFPESALARLLEDTSEGGSDTETLTRIGQRLGDLPLNLRLPTLETGHHGVLLQSSSFGAGASLVRRQTTASLKAGEDWLLQRGVSLIGLRTDGHAIILDRLDQCAQDFTSEAHRPWAARIANTKEQFAAHVIAVHDTAFCGSSIDPLNEILEGLPLAELSTSKMREAYLGIITAQGDVFEVANRAFNRVRVLLSAQPDARDELTASSRFDPGLHLDARQGGSADRVTSENLVMTRGRQSDAPVVLAAMSVEPRKFAVGEKAETPGCIVPASRKNAPNVMPLKIGARVAQEQLHSTVGFVSGWWGAEGAGRWSGARRATLRLKLEQDDATAQLELQLAAAGGQPRDLSVLHGGQTLATKSVGRTGTFTLDANLLPKGRPIDLDLVASGAALSCPEARGQGADPRQLAFMLKSVALVRTPEPKERVVPAGVDPFETVSQSTPRRPFAHAIAHGGGRYVGSAISNSFEAIHQNTPRFEVVELDFNWTSDGELVCLHDWVDSFTSRFGSDSIGPVAHARFRSLLSASPDRPRNCDLDGLAGWMRASPDILIVTDVKERPVDAHRLIAERHPDLMDQFVPQAYQPTEIGLYRALGFKSVIWTLYRFGANRDAVVNAALEYAPSAITMPVLMARSGLLQAVREATNLPVYVHTVNDKNTAGCLLLAGASGIYSDDLGEADVVALAAHQTTCQ